MIWILGIIIKQRAHYSLNTAMRGQDRRASSEVVIFYNVQFIL